MLDCIRDTEAAVRNIAAHRKENTKELTAYLSQGKPVSRIILVGSGSSNTAAITARAWMEKITKLPVQVALPNVVLYETAAYDPDALYVFTSQTGTSKMVGEALKFIQKAGIRNTVISEASTSPMAKQGDTFVNMDCGIEEYPMRTVGYTSTVMTMMVIALEIASMYGTCTEEEYQAIVTEMEKTADRVPVVIDKAIVWAEKVRRQILRSDLIVFTGGDEMYGVALEGAMKIWETLQTASVGYEIEDGIHGPNYGYNYRHCVITLNNGRRESAKCHALASYMKDVWHNGLQIGADPIDENDLELAIPDNEMAYVDMVLACQVLTYVTARDQGRDLMLHHDNSRMEAYFTTHHETK